MVPDDFLRNLLDLIQKDPSTLVKIDLDKQELVVIPTGETISFEINPYKKECLLKGLDDIDYLLNIKELITAYEFRNTLKR
jgi:3-isopropylmalate/(R)-2-methylmalate dehydratase small subunit